MKKITGYKGFNPDMTCRGFKYQEGETYETGTADVCKSGFHFCENPIDIFSYYNLNESIYHKVESSGDTDTHDQDSKIATTRIKIGVRVNLVQLTMASVDFILGHCKKDKKKTAHLTGDQSVASNTGDHSAASNTGDQSAASNTGDYSAASNTGDQSAASNTGYHSAASNTGYKSAASNTGDQSAASNTGYHSAASVEGKQSIACGLGHKNRAKGALGCWLVLAEWDEKGDKIKTVKSAFVDGKKIKADTWYELRKGRFVIRKVTA